MKLRVFDFDETPEQRDRFPLIYQGFVVGGDSIKSKGMEVTRREARILDKLEAISDEDADLGRKLKPGPQRFELEQPEYELLLRYFEATPWSTRVSRKIVAVHDWMKAIPLDE